MNQPTESPLLSQLKKVPIFESFPPQQLEALVQAGKEVHHIAGEVLFHEGDAAEDFYLILSGSVEVSGLNAAGETIKLTRLYTGESFGELALAEEGVRTANVHTISSCVLLKISRQAFLKTVAETPELIHNVIKNISQMIRRANQQYLNEQLKHQQTMLTRKKQSRERTQRLIKGIQTSLHAPVNDLYKAIQNMPYDMMQTETQQNFHTEVENAMSRLYLLDHSIQSLTQSSSLPPSSVTWPSLWEELRALYQSSSFREIPLHIEIKTQQAWEGSADTLKEIMLAFFLNIEQHAYPAHLENKEEKGIWITLDTQATDFVLTVLDHGVGMNEETLQKCTDPFFTTEAENEGLGLSVAVHRIENELQGDIEFQSTPQQGTRIRLIFPQKRKG